MNPTGSNPSNINMFFTKIIKEKFNIDPPVDKMLYQNTPDVISELIQKNPREPSNGTVWPAIFSNHALIATRHPAGLCGDVIMAWGILAAGGPMHTRFGDTLVKVGQALGGKVDLTDKAALFAYADKLLTAEGK